LDLFWIVSLILVETASSLYFLYVPAGYQGGRNPRYNMVILFERDTWGEIHTWTSFVLSAIILFHIIIHWSWVKNVFWRYLQVWKNKIGANNKMAIVNLVDDGLSAVLFLFCLISGLALFIVPGGRAVIMLNSSISPVECGRISISGPESEWCWAWLYTWLSIGVGYAR
jgi:hypothetical protein